MFNIKKIATYSIQETPCKVSQADSPSTNKKHHVKWVKLTVQAQLNEIR